jgi:hypothetical protein
MSINILPIQQTAPPPQLSYTGPECHSPYLDSAGIAIPGQRLRYLKRVDGAFCHTRKAPTSRECGLGESRGDRLMAVLSLRGGAGQDACQGVAGGAGYLLQVDSGELAVALEDAAVYDH